VDNPYFTEEKQKIIQLKDEIKTGYKNIFEDNKPYFKELTSNLSHLPFSPLTGSKINYNPLFDLTTKNSPWNSMKLKYNNV
jgi:hypothetical protein